MTAASGATGSIFRRIVGTDRSVHDDPRRSLGDDMPPAPQPVEAELAESLDSVLGIVGRLAASHDRSELVRMIVDETKRALAVDATVIRLAHEDRLEMTAWAGLSDVTVRDMPSGWQCLVEAGSARQSLQRSAVQR